MFRNINADEAKKEYDNGTLFIDVREQMEFDEVRIPGATLIPMSQIQNRWQEIPQDKEVLIYCRSGSRSANLVSQLAQMGYSKLMNLGNGIIEWHQQQYPVESGSQNS